MSRYADLMTLREYLDTKGQLGTAEDGLLQSSLDRAERAIDDYTRRNFAGTAGTVQYNRYYQEAVRRNAFYLDRDLHTLISLTTGISQTIPLGSVWLEPMGQGPPYRIIRLHSAYAYAWNTDQNMVVAGTWGFSTVPPDAVVQATVLYATYLYRSKDVAPGDTVGFEQGGVQTVPKGMPDHVRYLLSPYRSKTGGAV